MKTLDELLAVLTEAKACGIAGSTPLALCWEQGCYDEQYDPKCLEAITDIRLVDEWPLPGDSLVVPSEEKPQRLVFFYDELSKQDSSVALDVAA